MMFFLLYLKTFLYAFYFNYFLLNCLTVSVFRLFNDVTQHIIPFSKLSHYDNTL